MLFTYKTVASIGVLVFGLFALSGSGPIVGTGVALLVLGLVTPAILMTVGGKLWKGSVTRARDARLLALADAHDVMRMDSDKG